MYKMHKRGKRAQLTIFIIIAILIVASVGMFFVFRDNSGPKDVPDEVTPIYVYVFSCLEETVQNGINHLSLRGGYYNIPDEFLLEYYTEDYSYYFLNNQSVFPTKRIIEEELEKYISLRARDCLNFSVFGNQGFEIQGQDMEVSCEINENLVEIEVYFPLLISREDWSTEIKDFSLETPSNIEDFIILYKIIVEDYSFNSGKVCLNCIEDYQEFFGFSVTSQIFSKDFVSSEKDVVLFSIKDSENDLDWRFVVEI